MKKTCYFLMLAACTAVLSLGSVASAEIIIADAAADYIDQNTLPVPDWLRSAVRPHWSELTLMPSYFRSGLLGSINNPP